MVFGLIVAKVLLLGINVCTAALSAGLIYIGTRKVDYKDLGETIYDGGAKGVLVDPYILLLFTGSLLLYISIKGLIGACTGSKKILLIYMAFLLLWCAAMVYASVMCFFFAHKSDQIVEKYWQQWKNELPEEYQDDEKLRAAEEHLKSAGALCAVTSLLLLLELWCSSRIMGHDYMFKRTTQVVNFTCFLLGGGVIYLAVVAGKKHYGEEWAPYYIGFLGGATVILSAVGLAGISDERRGLLKLHLASLSLIFVLMVAAVTASFVYADDARRVWHTLLVKFVEVEDQIIADLKPPGPPPPPGVLAPPPLAPQAEPEIPKSLEEAHMIALGVLGSVLSVMLLLNIAASWYFLRLTAEEGEEGGRRKRGGRRRKRGRGGGRRRQRSSSDEGSEDSGDSEDDRRSLRRSTSSRKKEEKKREKVYDNEAYDGEDRL